MTPSSRRVVQVPEFGVKVGKHGGLPVAVRVIGWWSGIDRNRYSVDTLSHPLQPVQFLLKAGCLLLRLDASVSLSVIQRPIEGHANFQLGTVTKM